MPNHVVVLAAGKGTRMKSARPKVLHRAAGLPLLDHVLRAAATLEPASIVLVLGHQADLVREALGKRLGLSFALQEPQLGTGHALLQAEQALAGAEGTVVLLSGDVPLLRPATLRALVERHEASGAAATVLTATVPAPDGYGRIVRDASGQIARIVEHKDATPAEHAIGEINSGIYAFDLAPLFDALRAIGSANAQGEYYLPDLVTIYRSRGLVVETLTLEDPGEIRRRQQPKGAGRGDRDSAGGKERRADGGRGDDRRSRQHVHRSGRQHRADTVIRPGVYLEGRTRIGSGCEIHSGVRIVDSTIEDGVVINNFCVIVDSVIRQGARLGPFAHIRPQCDVGESAHVGNFVELKKTSMGRGSKANHLAYLGDATIGEKVNVGAGTITCNYDGTAKHPTVIEDGAFIGSDTQLVAPVRVGKGAYVAAGSSITKDVPADALAVARGKQVNKEGWAARKRAGRG
jgi:bifunctional UDP-N-acetylglucosamine pyrophosphorylase / glucosamine-1-phosphate N-acetyltransferase